MQRTLRSVLKLRAGAQTVSFAIVRTSLKRTRDPASDSARILAKDSSHRERTECIDGHGVYGTSGMGDTATRRGIVTP